MCNKIASIEKSLSNIFWDIHGFITSKLAMGLQLTVTDLDKVIEASLCGQRLLMKQLYECKASLKELEQSTYHLPTGLFVLFLSDQVIYPRTQYAQCLQHALIFFSAHKTTLLLLAH